MSPPNGPDLNMLDSDDYIMDIMRVCAESPMFNSPSAILAAQARSTEAIYHIRSTMAEIDPLMKGLSSKDIITYLTSKGAVIDASMKRHIRAELMKGARKGELDYYEDEYTRRKYFLRY